MHIFAKTLTLNPKKDVLGLRLESNFLAPKQCFVKFWRIFNTKCLSLNRNFIDLPLILNNNFSAVKYKMIDLPLIYDTLISAVKYKIWILSLILKHPY
ncbi:MAG: hypothetical protein WCG05_04290 [Alphaproteobacteria bacterium]